MSGARGSGCRRSWGTIWLPYVRSWRLKAPFQLRIPLILVLLFFLFLIIEWTVVFAHIGVAGVVIEGLRLRWTVYPVSRIHSSRIIHGCFILQSQIAFCQKGFVPNTTRPPITIRVAVFIKHSKERAGRTAAQTRLHTAIVFLLNFILARCRHHQWRLADFHISLIVRLFLLSIVFALEIFIIIVVICLSPISFMSISSIFKLM